MLTDIQGKLQIPVCGADGCGTIQSMALLRSLRYDPLSEAQIEYCVSSSLFDVRASTCLVVEIEVANADRPLQVSDIGALGAHIGLV